jgi:type IV secretory pathway VirB10-like protein
MKKLLMTLTIALFALPLLADDTAKPVDSPLVAAAKKSTRLKKKPTNVITNETVKKKNNAHVTTSATQPPLPTVPPGYVSAEDEMRRANAQRAEDAKAKAAEDAKAKETDQARQQRLAIAAAAAESGYADDPDLAERKAAEAAKAEKEKETEKKPPQR